MKTKGRRKSTNIEDRRPSLFTKQHRARREVGELNLFPPSERDAQVLKTVAKAQRIESDRRMTKAAEYGGGNLYSRSGPIHDYYIEPHRRPVRPSHKRIEAPSAMAGRR